MAPKGPGERKSRTSLTLNQKLEMIKLSEEGLSKAEIGRKLGLLRQTVSQVVNAKEKFLKERESATPLNTRMLRKRNSLLADMEKALVAWMEDQARRNIPLSQSLIQSKALTLFNSMKAARGAGAAQEKFEASRGWFKRFQERSRFPTRPAPRGADEALLLVGEQREWLLAMEPTPGEDAVRIVQMTTADLEYYTNLVDQAAAGFERIDPNVERSSAAGRMLSHSIACYREILRQRKRQPEPQASPPTELKRWRRPPQAPAAAALRGQQPSTPEQDPPPAKRFPLAAGSDDG